jgi:hypothetical protein
VLTQATRGAARDRAHAEQGKDFSGLQFGKITPTDIDGSVDFAGRVFVVIEAKYRGAAMPVGQRKHLEYVCASHHKAKHPAAALVVSHDTPPDEQIKFADCIVTEAWWAGKWLKPATQITCREAIEKLLARCGVTY